MNAAASGPSHWVFSSSLELSGMKRSCWVKAAACAIGAVVGTAGLTPRAGAQNTFSRSFAPAGDQRILVVNFDFPDLKFVQNADEAQLRTRLTNNFRDTERFYRKVSYGKMGRMQLTFAPRFTLGSRADSFARSDFNRLVREASATVRGLSNLSPSDFDHTVYAYPKGSPVQVGGISARDREIFTYDPTGGVLNGGLTHEFGHAIDVDHAGTWNAAGGNLFNHGRFEEGSDPFDIMGSGGNEDFADFNVVQREARGWLPASSIRGYPFFRQGVRTLRLYQLNAPSVGDGRYRGARLSFGGRELWLSYTPDQERYSFYRTVRGIAGARPGLVMHSVRSRTLTGRYDFTPGSRTASRLPGNADGADGDLQVGRSATIREAGQYLTLEVLGTGGRGPGERYLDVRLRRGTGTGAPAPAPAGARVEREGLYDFGTDRSPVYRNYTRITPGTRSGVARWLDDRPRDARDRGVGNGLNRDFVFGREPSTFGVDVRDGLWEVTATFGDATNAHDDMGIAIEGEIRNTNIDRAAGQTTNVVYRARVSDGRLDVQFFDTGGRDVNWTVNRMKVTRVSD